MQPLVVEHRQSPSAQRSRAFAWVRWWSIAWLALPVSLAEPAAAQEPAQGEPGEAPEPPPISVDEFHYGVAVAFETVASAGDVCPAGAFAPCILGSGGGLAIRFGYRSQSPWYVGGAYEFSRQDASNLLRLPILQQLRAEIRYYLDYGKRVTPFAQAAVGATAYGSEWAVDTGGMVGGLGAGFEVEVSRTAVVGATLIYRPFVLRHWTDTAGQRRADRFLGFGLAHVVGLELTLALRDPLPRW
jgi:hypothetical protein